MVQILPTRYLVPKGQVVKRFLTILTHEFCQAREQKWNSEKPLIFAAVVLQLTPEVRQAKDVCKRLTQQMN
jgi:hypothetical protein